MERKVCVNASCRATNALQWRKGWPMRSGELADLCDRCGSAYDNSIYCETFHSEQSGWRECEYCHKRVHCGCIVASSFIELMDFGGVRCVSCSKDSQHHLTNTAECKGEEEEKSKPLQLFEFMDIDELNLLRKPSSNVPPAPSQEIISQGLKHPIVGISNLSSNGSCMLTTQSECKPLQDKFKDVHKALGHASLNISLATPTEAANLLLPCSSSSAREGNEQTLVPSSSSSFQLRQSSCPIMPSLSLPGNIGNNIVPGTSRAMLPQVRVARPPAEGRGKNQLLPRYWPRITDQELQQLSGDLNSTIVPLFEKVLSASDAGRIGRLVLPKACAEAYFPPIAQSEGVPVRIQDVKGNEWTFQFRFWPNNNSRMYVLEGVTPCIQSMQLRAGDTVTFSRINPGGKLMIGFRKSSNSMERPKQESGTSAVSSSTPNREAPFMGNIPTTSRDRDYSDLLNTLNGIKDRHGNPPFDPVNDSGGEFSWNKNKDVHEEASQQPQISEKKKARNIGSKNRRMLMHCEDVMEVRLTWEEAQDLLRPPAGAIPSVVTIDGHDFEEYDEPPIFGKRTIYVNRHSGGQEQWGQCDECSKWRKLPVDVLLPPKWTCSDNAWDSERRSCSAPEEMNPKELEGVLRAVKDSRKRRVVENQNGAGLTREISGLDALASAAVLGESIAATSSAGPTTKHPRHRAGCSCIVCIQPPSGKGKHKSTCTCQVCMTVKRRFKTLMLRKKKRQSDAIAAASAVLDVAVPETLLLVPVPLSENSNGPIDLNCDPNREDADLEPKRLEITKLGRFPGISGLPGLELESVLPRVDNNGEEESESSTDEESDEVEDEAAAADEVAPSDNIATPPTPQEPNSDDVD